MGQRDFPGGHVCEFASTVIGPSLGLAPRAAEDRVDMAARITATMWMTLAAMAAGSLDWARARAIGDELVDADADVVTAVEDAIFPKVLTDTTGEARRRSRRALQRADASLLAERAKPARERRGLQRWQGEPGLTEWHATVPSERAAQAWAAMSGPIADQGSAPRPSMSTRRSAGRPSTPNPVPECCTWPDPAASGPPGSASP